ncbi:CHAT domain-containing protein [Nonomuraea sp. NPDC003201]
MSDPAAFPRQTGAEDGDLEELRVAWQELNEIVEEIRQVQGYENFLMAPTFDDVSAAAVQPLCYISATEAEGIALVVRENGDVDPVVLPHLTTDSVRSRVSALLTSYDEFQADPSAAAGPWTADLDAATRWLWDTVMEPLLEAVEEDPAITLVTGGLLGLLPLHAAWTPDRTRPTGRAYALDTTTISYAPNARSLTAARRIAAERRRQTLLAVINPQPMPAGYRPTPFTELEASVIGEATRGTARSLAGTEATLPNVRRELPAADVVHFACHGHANLVDPLESGLMLSGGQALRVRDLLEMDLRIRVAVLSSCEASLPGTELPDEVIGLPTGLLQAGAAGVVAPLWAVPDVRTSMLMTEFYRDWRSASWTPAEALRRAQIWLRDTTNEEKVEVWERAFDDDSAWPGPEVADALLDRVLPREPDRRDESPLHLWAAFSHVGV